MSRILFLACLLLPACTCGKESTKPATGAETPARDMPDRQVPRLGLPDRDDGAPARQGAPRPRDLSGREIVGMDQGREERRAQRLAEVDSDGDGAISDDERQAALAARREERRAMLDSDGDGLISDDERDAARAERVANMVAASDSDGDGRISRDEAAEARGPRRRAFRDFAAADTDGDGYLSEAEVAASLARLQVRRRGADPGAAGDAAP